MTAAIQRPALPTQSRDSPVTILRTPYRVTTPKRRDSRIAGTTMLQSLVCELSNILIRSGFFVFGQAGPFPVWAWCLPWTQDAVAFGSGFNKNIPLQRETSPVKTSVYFLKRLPGSDKYLYTELDIRHTEIVTTA